ncbi:dienelactone hydrolase family protein [Solirubrobacter soli]|uniref:dienelactone hydrolase family protein n=1 Tax=Solirubrobacter soli TaxID=363832 RepID=UPI00040B6AB9|nr:dienelactone hydrolase family protein [Solirubrobacter soli]
MTELQQYLADEVAEDHADGIITRREAVRRLGLLGVTAATASAMLTAEAAARTGGGHGGHDHDHGHGKHGHKPEAATSAWAPAARESITFSGPTGPLLAAWAPAVKPRGGVLVIHENRGLTEHIKNVAGRFAASGYSALALDLLSEEGGTGAFPGEAEVAAKLSEISGSNPGRFDADMKAALTELEKRVPRKSTLGAIGFCFGGGMIWRLLAAREPRLDAAAPFYGPFPTGGNLGGNKANVLGVYGGLDARVNGTMPAAKASLDAARLDYELLTFTEADHAFFNDTGARFNVPAAEEAWRRVIGWFDHAGDHGHR